MKWSYNQQNCGVIYTICMWIWIYTKRKCHCAINLFANQLPNTPFAWLKRKNKQQVEQKQDDRHIGVSKTRKETSDVSPLRDDTKSSQKQ